MESLNNLIIQVTNSNLSISLPLWLKKIQLY